MKPLINSTVNNPLVTKKGWEGLASGLFNSMRLLSKYCTSLSLSADADWLYCSSRPGVLGPGPQNHVRESLPCFTSRSVRFHTVWKAGWAKGNGPPPAWYSSLETTMVGTGVVVPVVPTVPVVTTVPDATAVPEATAVVVPVALGTVP